MDARKDLLMDFIGKFIGAPMLYYSYKGSLFHPIEEFSLDMLTADYPHIQFSEIENGQYYLHDFNVIKTKVMGV
jgi:hypothetical protein